MNKRKENSKKISAPRQKRKKRIIKNIENRLCSKEKYLVYIIPPTLCDEDESFYKEFLEYFWCPKQEDIRSLLKYVNKDSVLSFLSTLRVSNEDLICFASESQRTAIWYELRYGRLTASNFGKANYTNKNVSFGRSLMELIWPDQIQSSNMATNHGVINEDNGADTYETYKKLQLESLDKNPDDFVMTFPGFLVCKKYPWLGGSPDFVVNYEGNSWLGEIKCPFPNRTTGEAKIYEDIPHYYYDQIQGLMAIADLPFCDFVVWTRQYTEISRFDFDREYFGKFLFPSLQSFYIKHLLGRYILKRKGALVKGSVDLDEIVDIFIK